MIKNRTETAIKHKSTKKKNPKGVLLKKEWIGVEPTNDGFADQSLTAWVPLQKNVVLLYQKRIDVSIAGEGSF